MNKPNILSNELDQVAKKGKWYREELNTNSDLKQQIISAFDMDDFPMKENDFFISQTEKEIVERLFANNEKLPMEQIAKMLRSVSMVSCEIQRKQKEKSGGWSEAIGPAIPKNSINLGTVLTRNKEEEIEGHIITYISFAKLNNKQYPDVKITAKQIEFPGEGAMLSKYIVFQKEMTGEEFKTANIEL